jgi:hypothetical protein
MESKFELDKSQSIKPMILPSQSSPYGTIMDKVFAVWDLGFGVYLAKVLGTWHFFFFFFFFEEKEPNIYAFGPNLLYIYIYIYYLFIFFKW